MKYFQSVVHLLYCQIFIQESEDSSKDMKARRPNPPIVVPKMQREERRRKPAIDESEFIVMTTASNAAKKRKLNQQNLVVPVKEKELPVLMVPEILKLQSNSENLEGVKRGSIEEEKHNLPFESATQKEILIAPQIIQNSSENRITDEQSNLQGSRQDETVLEISEESSNCFDELSPNDNQPLDSMDQSQAVEEKFSAEFPEDEFLLDSLEDPLPNSSQNKEAFTAKSPQVQSQSLEQYETTPVVKPKRGRPSKKAQVETLRSEIDSSPQLVTTEFATPLEKPKRGRKKMETYSAPELISDPKPLYESIPGKRMRKKIDYRELSGEIEHKSPRQNREVATPTSGNIFVFL